MSWQDLLLSKLQALKWRGTGFIFISASTAIVARPSCRLQLIMLVIYTSVNTTRQ